MNQASNSRRTSNQFALAAEIPNTEYTQPLNFKNFHTQTLHREIRQKLINYISTFILEKFPYPTLNLPEFIYTIHSKTKSSLTSLLLALYYLSKLKRLHPTCSGSQGSAQKLILAALITANKYLFDDTYENRAWATVSLYNIESVSRMENEFLRYVDYDLFVNETEWKSFISFISLDCGIVLDSKVISNWDYCDEFGFQCDDIVVGYGYSSEFIMKI